MFLYPACYAMLSYAINAFIHSKSKYQRKFIVYTVQCTVFTVQSSPWSKSKSVQE